jgi:hypothetical protein
MPTRKSFIYCYDVPIQKKDDAPPTFGGRVLGFNVRLARRLLRAILKVRALPRGTQVYRLTEAVYVR